jgi:hypothetical protein
LLFAFDGLVVRVMVFNTTFNNTSVAVSFIGGAGKPLDKEGMFFSCIKIGHVTCLCIFDHI